jgi:hypothetical protein
VKGSRLIRFSRGVTLEPEPARPFAARHGLAARGLWRERLGGECERDPVHRLPRRRQPAPVNHLGENVEVFAAAALARDEFPVDAAGILQTVSALDTVFRSVEAGGAWQAV